MQNPKELRELGMFLVLGFVAAVMLIAAWFVLGLLAEQSKDKYPWMRGVTYFVGLIGLLAALVWIFRSQILNIIQTLMR